MGAEPSSPDASSPYLGGQLIGDKYRLLRRLGEGGMAAVWVAHNEALDIHVAIKFIRSDLQAGDLTSRLLQEARAAARLGHPAIVRVSDFGKTPRGDPYIVMELLTGEDLGATIKRRGPVQALRAVRTLLPIADALATAHAKKIVHRDLKPENIFLSQNEDGKTQPKLVDFGIAKLEREDNIRITQIGAAMGSPAYMSPEQARGLDVDHRCDVWAFCVVLYEALTGQLPYNGNTYTALVCSIMEGRPRPITELGAGDPDLWGIIAKGLEKDLDKRWASMREVGHALALWAMARGASDDITGASLQSSWVERPPDSIPAGTPASTMPAIAPLLAVGSSPDGGPLAVGSSSQGGPIATQLSATVSGQARGKSRSLFLIAGGAAFVVLGIFAGVIVMAAGGRKAAPIRSEPTVTTPATDRTGSAQPKIEPAPPPSVEPEVGAGPLPSAEPPDGKKPRVDKPSTKPRSGAEKPSQKPTEKPSQKPTEKPPEKPQKPPDKPPPDDLKPL